MSVISFRPRGGMNGIEVTDDELNSFANLMNSNYLDSVIPLPDVDANEQIERLSNCESNHDNADVQYYERPNGQHGWCCSHCGKVVQWG